jgi:hypothetical protein
MVLKLPRHYSEVPALLENHRSVLVFLLQPCELPATLAGRSPEAQRPQRRSLSFDVSAGCSSHRPRCLCWLPLALPRRDAGAERPPRTPEGHVGAARRSEPGRASALSLSLSSTERYSPIKLDPSPFLPAVSLSSSSRPQSRPPSRSPKFSPAAPPRPNPSAQELPLLPRQPSDTLWSSL